MDDWDSVSDTTPSNSAADPLDTALTPQPLSQHPSAAPDNPGSGSVPHPSLSRQNTAVPPPRPPRRAAFRFSSLNRGVVLSPLLKRAVLVVVVIILVLVAGQLFHQYGSGYTSHTSASVTAGADTTIYTNATAMAQALATTTTAQQMYTQATSGTPAVDDPLSDDRNNWKLLANDSGEKCAFAGGAYHLILSKPSDVIWCESNVISGFNNFTLQVGMTIVQGNDGSIVFGENSNGAYSIDIHPDGIYALYQIHWNQPPVNLRYGSSSAIKQGLNQANMITISVNNNNFYLYANKQPLTSDYLTDYSSGAIHFSAVGNDQAATDIAYSDLDVWKL